MFVWRHGAESLVRETSDSKGQQTTSRTIGQPLPAATLVLDGIAHQGHDSEQALVAVRRAAIGSGRLLDALGELGLSLRRRKQEW